MIYRPNFCCHCGEKIARSRWTILTSRRFCDFCEIEQKQHDLLPRVVVVLAMLIGSAGFTAYISGRGNEASVKPRHLSAASPSRAAPPTVQPSADLQNVNRVENSPAATRPAAEALSGQREPRASSSIEPVFFCGAVTRKGTACTRRVKTRSRCWQHAGKPDAPDTELSEGTR